MSRAGDRTAADPAALAGIAAAARDRHLSILGGFHAGPEDADTLPPGTGTLLLLGPDEPAFWHAFTASGPYADGAPNPMDRWSRQLIGPLAAKLGGRALYPFGPQPFHPFFSWALRTGRIHASPIRLLVHDRAGLMVSFRGALALPGRVALPPAPPSPCDSCADRPCLTACPVDALNGKGYDVPRCTGFLATPEGRDCMGRGCAARRACPVSQDFPRLDAQSAFHMAHFVG